jgi:hypothetical protein
MDWIDLQAPALDVGAVRRVRDDGSKAAGSFLHPLDRHAGRQHHFRKSSRRP